MKFIVGKKLGMTQVFRDNGEVVPVTRISAGPCVVTQVKVKEKNKDSVNAVQVGFGEQKLFRVKKPQQGHLKDLTTVRFMRDFRVEDGHGLKRGDVFTVKIFKPGDKVNVVGKSKGRGFQGVVKRHGFHGSPASHGHKDQLRMPGSIGSTDSARVFKGTRMAGRMGNDRVTIKNLEIMGVKEDDNELLIKGAIPGARGGLLLISTEEGKIEIEVPIQVEEAVEKSENSKEEDPKKEIDEKEVSQGPEVKEIKAEDNLEQEGEQEGEKNETKEISDEKKENKKAGEEDIKKEEEKSK